MQILEGDEAAVRRVFERIVRDERHTHILELAWNPIVERDFPAWSMELADLGAEEIDPAMKKAITASSMREASHPLHALFQEIRQEM